MSEFTDQQDSTATTSALHTVNSATAQIPSRATDIDTLRRTPVWSDELVRASGLRTTDVPFVTVGGGLASFALVDVMRICGVRAEEIRVVSPLRKPYENLRYLMRRSQIVDNDPLRSDSMSRMDNIWGFPSYAIEQAMLQRSARPLWNVLTEPLASEFFNPCPTQVFGGVDREATRIGWGSMTMAARVQLVRRREGGGYFCLACPTNGSTPVVLRSQFVHLGTGYPSVNYPSEVSDLRTRHGDYFTVVNAYEPHEHVYQVLTRRPGTVVVRGSGITASRVLQRLLDDRVRSGQDVLILHLFRTYVDGPRGPWSFRRRGGHGWSYQAFSFPKAASSGQLRHRLREMDDARRAEFIKSMSGTTSAKRRHWQRQLRQGRSTGHYRALHGDIQEMTPTEHGTVELRVDVNGLPANTKLDVDFVIDCTGLRLRLQDSPLLADLIEATGAVVNPLGGLAVGPHFAVRGADQAPGRLYASGVITQGGYLAPVDSFSGFSHAALLICDDLARQGFCGRLGLTRSMANWLKWLKGAQP